MIELNNAKTKNFVGMIELTITGIIWGFIGLFVKELYKEGCTPELSAFFRVFFAMTFAGIVSLFMYGVKAFRLTKTQLIWCIIDGVVTQGIYNYVYSISVKECGVAISSVLLYTSPVFNAIISYLAFREKLGFRRNMILVLNMLGCIVAATGLDFSFKVISLFGIFMGIMSGLTYGAAPVLGKYVNQNPNLFIVIFYTELFASIFMLIFTRPFATVEYISTKMWFYGIMYGVVITGVAYMFYYDGVKKMKEVSIVPVICSLEPVVATIIGLYLYKEPLNIFSIMGIVLVIISIILMSIVSKQKA